MCLKHISVELKELEQKIKEQTEKAGVDYKQVIKD